MNKLPKRLQGWIDARKRYHLSHAHVQMARELGLNPRKLGGKANRDQEPWKAPLPVFIECLYQERFGRESPERVVSIEQYVAEKVRNYSAEKAKRERRKERKAWRSEAMCHEHARDWCARWLPLWTGNQPEALIECYGDGAFYRDPARPDGIRGKDELLAYFRRLLARFPTWAWTAEEVLPIAGGFVLKWKAVIPVGSSNIVETGLDIVRCNGEVIVHNEVYFDRSSLLEALGRESASFAEPLNPQTRRSD